MTSLEYKDLMAKLDEILAHVRNLDVLAEKRENNRRYMADYRKKHQQNVNLHDCVNLQTTNKEEEGKGEEKSPHTPLKGEGREEGETCLFSRARVCEGSAGQPTPAPETPKNDPEPPTDGEKKPKKGKKSSEGDPEKGKNIPPTVEQVDAWLKARYPKATFDAEQFWSFYESKGWFVGKNKMTNWHSAMVTWVNRRSYAPTAPAVNMNLLAAQARRKADNWRGTPKELIEHVF